MPLFSDRNGRDRVRQPAILGMNPPKPKNRIVLEGLIVNHIRSLKFIFAHYKIYICIYIAQNVSFEV